MSASRTFHFDRYMLRPVDETDRTFAINWTLADPDHKDLTAPDFWLEQTATRDSYVLLDGQGRVFFLKLHQMDANSVDIHIQFAPEYTRDQALRVGRALMVGLDWLEGKLRDHGVSHLAFDSHSQGLVSFAVKKLNFSKTKDFRLEKEIGV
jgi:hypothetical protein